MCIFLGFYFPVLIYPHSFARVIDSSILFCFFLLPTCGGIFSFVSFLLCTYWFCWSSSFVYNLSIIFIVFLHFAFSCVFFLSIRSLSPHDHLVIIISFCLMRASRLLKITAFFMCVVKYVYCRVNVSAWLFVCVCVCVCILTSVVVCLVQSFWGSKFVWS